jgi:hypothetical protein
MTLISRPILERLRILYFCLFILFILTELCWFESEIRHLVGLSRVVLLVERRQAFVLEGFLDARFVNYW